MLSLIIADDEHKIRQTLKKLIDFDSLNLVLAEECSDGDALLESAARLKPDIVLTDMRMPGVSGEALLRELHSQNPTAKIIVLSGFDDFALVRQALMSKALDYLLKPVDATELNSILQKAAAQRSFELKEQQQWHNQRNGDCLEALLQQKKCIDPSVGDELGLANSNGEYHIAVANLYGQDGRPDRATATLVCYRAIAASVGCVCAYVDKKSDASVIMLLKFHSRQECLDFFNLLFSDSCLYADYHYLVGIGSPCYEPSLLKISYSEALMTLSEMQLGYADKISFYDSESCHTWTNVFTDSIAPLLRVSVESNNIPQFRTRLVEYYCGMSRDTVATISTLRSCNSLTLSLLGLLLTKAEAPKEAYQKLRSLEGEFAHVIDPGTSCMLVTGFIDEVFACSPLLRGEKKEITYKIRQYIQENYTDKISLQQLADHFYLTKGYLSKIFRQEFSMGVFDYVDLLRIEKTKELLMAGKTVREVTELVGYYDESHLDRKFKRLVGVSPKDYKA